MKEFKEEFARIFNLLAVQGLLLISLFIYAELRNPDGHILEPVGLYFMLTLLNILFSAIAGFMAGKDDAD